MGKWTKQERKEAEDYSSFSEIAPHLHDNGNNFLWIDTTDKRKAMSVLQKWVDANPKNKIVTIASDGASGYGAQTGWLVYYERHKE